MCGSVEQAMIAVGQADVYYARFGKGKQFRSERRAQIPGDLRSEDGEGERLVNRFDRLQLARRHGNDGLGRHGSLRFLSDVGLCVQYDSL